MRPRVNNVNLDLISEIAGSFSYFMQQMVIKTVPGKGDQEDYMVL